MTTTRSDALARPHAEPLMNGRCVGHTEYDERYGTVLVMDWHDPTGCEHVVAASLTYAERLELVVGYMNHLGYVHCLECATGNGAREPHASWVEMRSHNLASRDDVCDGCRRRLSVE